MAVSSTQANYENETSGSNTSVWLGTAQAPDFAPLQQDIDVDTVVIGAGIAGITTAYCLTQEGKKVVLIEDGLPCSGETGRTTAHIVNALDDFYSDLEKMHGEENARLAAESHTAAIHFIERTVAKENIDCEFTRLPGYLFLHPSDEIKTLQDELEASHRAGIKTELIDNVPGLAYEKGPALMYPDQAQFHPLKYLNVMLERIVEKGGKIYAHTHAENIKEGLVIANGFSIKANSIVVATNSPINNLFTTHTKQHAYRTYVIAALVPKGGAEQALWWDTGDQDSKWVSMPYTYVRTQAYDDTNDLLIVGGQDHKTGQADAEDITQQQRYSNLEEWARLRFPMMTEVVYNWSGQVMEPVDSLAFIGRNPGDNNIYIITGDSGNGMTHGTIGGMLVSDLIRGIDNPWRKLYDPARISLKATGDFLKEAGNMAAQYADFLKTGDIDSVKDLAPNEGAVLNVGLHKVAAYRNSEGTLNAYTAICPHLGCVLHWNADETSFDCPCHGSRFTNEGIVINGPALTDLKRFEIKDE